MPRRPDDKYARVRAKAKRRKLDQKARRKNMERNFLRGPDGWGVD